MGIIDSFKEKKAERDKGYGFKAFAEYMGGHSSHPKSTPGNIETTSEGVRFTAVFKELFTIPYGEIAGIDSDTAERLSLGRMLMVGLLAFAWKKKDKFLKITYKDHGLDTYVVLGKLNADEWRGIISRARASTLSQKT